jgi:redox-sensitive bicupin YhaK (pirin superfamily)
MDGTEGSRSQSTKDFVKKGGELEGIQLWLNLPAAKKMMQPNYQQVANDDFLVVTSEDKKVTTQVIAGELDAINGRIATQTPVNAYMIHANEDGFFDLKNR